MRAVFASVKSLNTRCSFVVEDARIGIRPWVFVVRPSIELRITSVDTSPVPVPVQGGPRHR